MPPKKYLNLLRQLAITQFKLMAFGATDEILDHYIAATTELTRWEL